MVTTIISAIFSVFSFLNKISDFYKRWRTETALKDKFDAKAKERADAIKKTRDKILRDRYPDRYK